MILADSSGVQNMNVTPYRSDMVSMVLANRVPVQAFGENSSRGFSQSKTSWMLWMPSVFSIRIISLHPQAFAFLHSSLNRICSLEDPQMFPAISNPGYKWNDDERTLVDKLVGIILAEEEYIKNDGSIGTRLKITRTIPVAKIRAGEYKVPGKKCLDKKPDPKPVTGNEPWMQVSETGNPFNQPT